MNSLVTLNTADGLEIKGELLATREEFYFTVNSITETETGRTFATVDAANEALGLAMDSEYLENLACKQVGI